MAAMAAGPLRVVRLDADGCPTGEVVEVDAFDITMSQTPSEDQEPFSVGNLKEIHLTVELCMRPGARRKIIEAVGGIDFWKRSERVRRRYTRLARKVKRRQR